MTALVIGVQATSQGNPAGPGYAPGGQTLASAHISGDARAVKHVKFWDVATGTERVVLSTHKHWIIVLAFAPDGHTLASADSNGTIKLWNVSFGP